MQTELLPVDAREPDPELIARAGKILREGGLVAFPTETVYGLGGNALDPAAAERIYAAKGRPQDNPLIVHIAEIDALSAIAKEIPEAAVRLADAFWPGPLTIIFQKTKAVPSSTTGGLSTVAVRFPSHPVAQSLILAGGGYVAAPSANASGRPSPTTAQHVMEDLDGRIPMILDGGPVEIGLESTIVDVSGKEPVILRPGYIRQEMLRDILGEVPFDPAILGGRDAGRPRAPGMRYRHYAPRAPMTVFTGSREEIFARILRETRAAASDGLRVGVLCSEECASQLAEAMMGEVLPLIEILGARDDEEAAARSLYGCLRAMDERGAQRIFAEEPLAPKLGEAIGNRLRKAAGGAVVPAGEKGAEE